MLFNRQLSFGKVSKLLPTIDIQYNVYFKHATVIMVLSVVERSTGFLFFTGSRMSPMFRKEYLHSSSTTCSMNGNLDNYYR